MFAGEFTHIAYVSFIYAMRFYMRFQTRLALATENRKMKCLAVYVTSKLSDFGLKCYHSSAKSLIISQNTSTPRHRPPSRVATATNSVLLASRRLLRLITYCRLNVMQKFLVLFREKRSGLNATFFLCYRHVFFGTKFPSQPVITSFHPGVP